MKHVVVGQGGSNGGRIKGTGGEGIGGTGSNTSPCLQGGGAAVGPVIMLVLTSTATTIIMQEVVFRATRVLQP